MGAGASQVGDLVMVRASRNVSNALRAGQQQENEPAETPAPAAQLDGFAWARSWPQFMAALVDLEDRLGAQAECRKAAGLRPVNAGLSERHPAEGGFLVPARLRDAVLSYMTGAAIRPRASIIEMDSLSVPIPVLDAPDQSGGALGGLTFAWTEEHAAVTPTAPNFGALELYAKKFSGYLQGVPNELCADATSFTSFFMPRLVGRGLARAEDSAFFNGTGVGEPQGLLNAPGAMAVARANGGTIGHADIVAMLKALHPASNMSAVWLLAEDAFNLLLELYEVVGTAPSGQDVPPPGTLKKCCQCGQWELLGIEAIKTEHQPLAGDAGDVILADLSEYLIGDRQELLIERAANGAGFISDTSDFRLKERVDARFWPQSVITMPDGNTSSPLVVLN
jgi:HK97 family phage major capsid protein